jgi:5-carboxymethyl-2-hydroxymuconate isomerase
MPHVRIDYSPNLGERARVDRLCQTLLGELIALRYPSGEPVVPAAGTRVLAHAADHAAVGPDDQGRGFVYVNLRVTPGRSKDTIDQMGTVVRDAVARHFQAHPPQVAYRFTVHIDEGFPLYEGKGEGA